MWYIEYLRARRALTVYAIIVAAMVVIALIVRANITVHTQSNVNHTPLDMIAVIAGFMIAILGTVLATSLSQHVNGHLEIAWTKPIPRDRLVAQTFAVDIGALFVAYIATIAVLILVNASYRQQMDFSVVKLGHIAAEFAFPVALYAFIQGVTAAMSRRSGTLAGLSWPILIFAAGLVQAPVPQIVHVAIVSINYLNPMALLATNSRMGVNTTTALGFSAWSIAALGDAVSIIVLGLALSLVQWRRLEA